MNNHISEEKMKKICAVCALLMAFSFIACGEKTTFNELLMDDPEQALKMAVDEARGEFDVKRAAKKVIEGCIVRGEVDRASAIANERGIPLREVVIAVFDDAKDNLERRKQLLENFGEELPLERKEKIAGAYYEKLMKEFKYFEASEWAKKYGLGKEKIDAAIVGLTMYEEQQDKSAEYVCQAAQNSTSDLDEGNKLAMACCAKAATFDGINNPDGMVRPCLDLIATRGLNEFLPDAKKLAGVYGIHLLLKNTEIDYIRAVTVMLKYGVDFGTVERALAAANGALNPMWIYAADIDLNR